MKMSIRFLAITRDSERLQSRFQEFQYQFHCMRIRLTCRNVDLHWVKNVSEDQSNKDRSEHFLWLFQNPSDYQVKLIAVEWLKWMGKIYRY